MKKIKLFFYFIFLANIFSSCSGFQEAAKVLRNEKVRSTDEFLVKKREPLTQPPNIKELPNPNSMAEKNDKEIGIKGILGAESEDNKKSSSSSVEDFIISQIKK